MLLCVCAQWGYFTTHLVVGVHHLAGVDDGEFRVEVGNLLIVLRPDEHVLGEVVLPRQLRDDPHVLARLGARPAIPIEHIPCFVLSWRFWLRRGGGGGIKISSCHGQGNTRSGVR